MSRAVFPALFCGGVTTLRELRELQRLAEQVQFRSDQTIFSDREQADTVFGLSSGIVRLYKLLPDGRHQILAFALPGDFLGMPLDKKRKFSADPIGPVTVCRFARDELTRFILSSPNMMRRIIEFAVR